MRKLLNILKKNWMLLLGLSLSVTTILAFFLFTNGVAELGNTLQSMKHGWLLAAVACVFLQWFFDSVGLQTLTLRHQPGRKLFSSFVTTMVGVLYSALTPSATGGQPMQVVSLNRQGMDVGTATSVIVVKTVLNQIGITIYALVMVFWELPFFQQHVSNFSFIVLFAVAVSLLFIAGLLLFTINRNLTIKISHRMIHLLYRLKLCRNEERLHEKLDVAFERFFVSAKNLGNSIPRCVAVVVLTLIQLTFFFAIPYCLYRGFGYSAESFVRLTAAATFVYFASMFVPVPGASGGAEGSFYLFFAPFFPNGTVAPAMLCWRVLTYYFAMLIGVIFTAMDKRKTDAVK